MSVDNRTTAKFASTSIAARPTTGHEWDGIEELNTPLPRWWVWTFYATVVWSLAYCVVYPAWPTAARRDTRAFSAGTRARRWSQDIADLQATARADARQDQGRAARQDRAQSGTARRGAHGRPGRLRQQLRRLPRRRRAGREGLSQSQRRRLDLGRQARRHQARRSSTACAGTPTRQTRVSVHAGLRPRRHSDARADLRRGGLCAHLWPRLPDARRADDRRAKSSSTRIARPAMASTARAIPRSARPICSTQVWLYGSDKAIVVARIVNGGGGVMPAWKDRLDDTTIKALTVYVHSLGGGQ